jgi:hypothetical protein
MAEVLWAVLSLFVFLSGLRGGYQAGSSPALKVTVLKQGGKEGSQEPL